MAYDRTKLEISSLMVEAKRCVVIAFLVNSVLGLEAKP